MEQLGEGDEKSPQRRVDLEKDLSEASGPAYQTPSERLKREVMSRETGNRTTPKTSKAKRKMQRVSKRKNRT